MDYTGNPVPANVVGFTQIAVGAYHTLALKSDGTVSAWGAAASSIHAYGQSEVPPELAGVQQVAAGAFHSLALKTDGTVVAWGRNTYWSPELYTGQATVLPNLSGVVQIAGGYFHTVAIAAKCPYAAADLDKNGRVEVADIGLLLLDFGPCQDCGSDLDGSSEVDAGDISALLLGVGEFFCSN